MRKLIEVATTSEKMRNEPTSYPQMKNKMDL